MERRGLDPPVLLKRKRARSKFAAAEIEYPRAALRPSRHQLPVHKVVSGTTTRAWCPSAIVRQDFVAKEKAEYRRDWLVFIENGQHLTAIAEPIHQHAKVAARKYRC